MATEYIYPLVPVSAFPPASLDADLASYSVDAERWWICYFDFSRNGGPNANAGSNAVPEIECGRL